ncbi:MAG: acetate--CoA ligase [Chlamydiales bacterium]
MNIFPNSVEHILHETRRIPPSKRVVDHALLKAKEYEQLYNESLRDPDQFWLSLADHIVWQKKPKMGCEWEWNTEQRRINHKWFSDGILNVTESCLDRHLQERGHKTALLWQGSRAEDISEITFQELHTEVCRVANALKNLGVSKGDRVCLYMPMIPEALIAILACARLGAIHSAVFGGFSAESLRSRIEDAQCKLLITANEATRGEKLIPLKSIVDKALEGNTPIETVIVVQRNESPFTLNQRDVLYHECIQNVSDLCPPTPMNAEDPLFILYTSGSTGKPKGVVHTQAGYLLHTTVSHRYVFDIHEDDIFWCTADIAWITGHSYSVYGPLSNGTTTLMFEGIPTYPHPGIYWETIQKHRVTKLYSTPTIIRTLIACNGNTTESYDLSSLKVLGTVGEPINPETWMWYHHYIGLENCPVVDTWWQTETGGIMITPLPGASTLKPGSALKPFFGVEPVILRDDGSVCNSDEGGSLCIKRPWPGMFRTTWKDHDKFIDTYFTRFPNLYFTGDGCVKDQEGDYWLLGRIDDVVTISGHRLGTAEIESALVSHSAVAEAAIAPYSDPLKGHRIYAFVVLIKDQNPSEKMKDELRQHVRNVIGPIAVPSKLQFTPQLPKTRSGKIMRRILRKIAENLLDDFGDLSTLSNPSVIDELCKNRKNQ